MADQADEVREEEFGACNSDNSFSVPGTLSRTEEQLIHDFTESSPPIMDVSRDKSRSSDGNLMNIPGPRILFPSQSTPVLGRDNPPLIEPVQDCCTPAIDCYSKSMIKFRNSAFMYIIQLVLFSIPVSAIVMGVLFSQNCPKAHFLPVFGALTGAMGAMFMAIWMNATYTHRHGKPFSNRQSYMFGMVTPVFGFLTMLDMIFVYSLWPRSDPSSPDYCNPTFYNFAFHKETATVASMVLSVMLYLPGNRHIVCCADCNSPGYVSL